MQRASGFAFPRLVAVLALALMTTAGVGLAQPTATSSAFVESVNISLTQSGGSVVTLNSGPTPSVTANAPPFTDVNNGISGVEVVSEELGVVLQTEALNARATSNVATTPSSTGEAVTSTLVLTLGGLFSLQAQQIRSTATVTGNCGSTLSATGTTTLANADAAGSTNPGTVPASPAPNFLFLNSGGVRVVLNEQILSGNGTAERTLAVNAVHIFLTNANIPGTGVLNGQIILGHSEANVRCSASSTGADLSITKSATPTSPAVGAALTYTLTVQNAGPDPADAVTVTDTLPSQVTFVSATPSQGTCSSATSTVTCNLGSIASGASATITIGVTATTAGNAVNTASVNSSTADPNTANNTATVTTLITTAPAPILSVTKTAGDPTVTVGQPIQYTIVVRNSGNAAANNVILTDAIAVTSTLSTVTTTTGDCTTESPINCTLGTLAPGASATITVVVIPTVPGILANTAVLGDLSSTVNTVVLLTGEPELSLTKTATPSSVRVSEPLTYTISVTNTGPSTANDVRLLDTIASGASLTSATATQGSCTSTSPVTCNLGSLASGASATITIVVVPNAAGVLVNTVLSGAQSSTVATNILPASGEPIPTLTITKTSSPQSVRVGETVTYEITVRNSGTTAAANVVVSDVISAFATLGAVTTTQGSCTNVSPVICSLGSIPAAGSARITIAVTANSGGTLTNTAAVLDQRATAVTTVRTDQLVVREIVFPIASRTAGARGSFWRTDMRIVNAGLNPAVVTVEWYPFASGPRVGPERSRQVTVEPGRAAVYDDVLDSLLDVAGNGSIRVLSDSASVVAAIRIFNSQQDGCLTGSFGDAFGGLDVTDFVTQGIIPLLSNELNSEAGIRTNVGFFNDSTQSSRVTLRVFTADGRLLGTKTLDLAPFANGQQNIFDLIDTVAVGDREQPDMYIHFTADGGLPFIYASAVYNSSNDGLIILPESF